MKFVAREDVESAVGDVWAVLADHETFERAAMRRGAEVMRSDNGEKPGWVIGFSFRGRRRKVTVRQARAEAPSTLLLEGEGKALEGTCQIDLVELGPKRTRMTVAVEIRPRTLAARLFLQSAKLARTRITKRFRQRIATLANMIESKTRGQTSGF